MQGTCDRLIGIHNAAGVAGQVSLKIDGLELALI